MDKFQSNVKAIQEKVKTKGLVISRVPQNTKSEFVKLAESEFADDFGLTLKALLDDYLIFNKIKDSFMNNKIKIIFENGKEM